MLLTGQETEGKTDGWKTARQWESEGGAADTVGFGGEGIRENKDVFTREDRERRNASLQMSHYC